MTRTEKFLVFVGRISLIAYAFATLISTSYGQSSAAPHTITYRFNLAQQLTGTILPDPDDSGPLGYLATRYTYGASGLLTIVETGQLYSWQSEDVAPASWTDFAIFQTLTISYDDWGRKLSESVSSAGTVHTLLQFSYDSVGRVECRALRMNPATFSSPPSTACALGAEGDFGPDRITRILYTNAHRVHKIQKAYGTPVQQDYATYGYVGANIRSVTDANGNRAEFEYDGFDRRTHWYFPSISSPGQANTGDFEQYKHDENGNRIYFRKRDGQEITYQYDALDRLTVKDMPGTVDDVYFGYELTGLQLYARFESPTGEGIANEYDGFQRIESTTSNMDGTSRSLSYIYDANGNRTRITHPDGQYFSYTYDGLDRVKQILQNGSAAVATLVYNQLGRRDRLIRLEGAVTTYGYDPLSRLDNISIDVAGAADDVDYGFEFNPAHQVVNRSISNGDYEHSNYSISTEAYVVNGLNQYDSVDGVSYGYDPNGNLTTIGAVSYEYDYENRLVSASGANGVTLEYDPLGRLYKVTEGEDTTYFLYDGSALVAEYSEDGVVVNRYVHGPGSDEPLIWYEGATVSSVARRFLYTDQLGSITGVTDSDGTVININTYDTYGVPDTQNVGRFGFTGQAYIPELELYHYKARVYAPKLGRFLQTDPIGYQDQINLYAYVQNDPVNAIDPTGMRNCDEPDDPRCVETPESAANPSEPEGVPEEQEVIDEIVVTAQKDRRTTEDTWIRFRPGEEQFFEVDESGMRERELRQREVQCSRRLSVIVGRAAPLGAGQSAAHSHGGGDDDSQVPGPGDNNYGYTSATAYVMTKGRVFAIDRASNSTYRTRLLSGAALSAAERAELIENMQNWESGRSSDSSKSDAERFCP